MAVSKSFVYSGDYDIGDIKSVFFEKREISVEFEPHKFRLVPHLYVIGKFTVENGEDITVEKEIDITTFSKVIVNSGIATILITEANNIIK